MRIQYPSSVNCFVLADTGELCLAKIVKFKFSLLKEKELNIFEISVKDHIFETISFERRIFSSKEKNELTYLSREVQPSKSIKLLNIGDKVTYKVNGIECIGEIGSDSYFVIDFENNLSYFEYEVLDYISRKKVKNPQRIRKW